MGKPYLIFREPESLNELKSLLRLRYKVYRESRLEKFCSENEAGIDMDCYDLRSRHFGLFKNGKNQTQPVGYVRMVMDEEGPFCQKILTLANGFPAISEKVNQIPEYPFPIMSYFPDVDVVWKVYREIKLEGERLIEPGRLSLDWSVRALSFAKHLVASIFAAAIAINVDKALLVCKPHHKNFYRLFGFRKLHGTDGCYCPTVGLTGCCLIGSPKRLPLPVRDKVLRMAEAYDKTGRICHYPCNPGSFNRPLKRITCKRRVLPQQL